MNINLIQSGETISAMQRLAVNMQVAPDLDNILMVVVVMQVGGGYILAEARSWSSGLQGQTRVTTLVE